MALDDQRQSIQAQVDAADDVVKHLVHVNFIRFVEVDASGRDLDRPAAIGYIVYNGEYQEFGQWSFSRSDDYTLEADVYDQIRAKHPRIAPFVEELRGFYLCGKWCALTDGHRVIH